MATPKGGTSWKFWVDSSFLSASSFHISRQHCLLWRPQSHDLHLEPCREQHALLCGGVVWNQSCLVSNNSKIPNTFSLMYMRKLFARVRAEVGTS